MTTGRVMAAMTLLSALGAALLLARYGHYPSLSDSWSYRFFAFRFRLDGVMHDFGTVRTYGYPLFLWALTPFSGFSFSRLAAVAGGVQWALHAAASLLLARGLRPLGPAVVLGTLAGLLLAPLGLALVTDALTEGLTLPLAVALAALAVRLAGPYAAWRTESVLLAGAGLAAYALMLRPGNLPVTVGWHLGILAAIALAPHWRAMRARMLAAALAAFVLAGLVVWGPQLAYALREVGTATILPACNLGAFQFGIGVLLWKYDTIVTAAGGTPWFTVNPLFEGTLPVDEALAWYTRYPLQGAATLLAHVVLPLGPRSPFVYIYDLDAPYGLSLRALQAAIAVFGAWRLLDHLRRARGTAWRSWTAALVLVATSCLGTIAITALSAPETRFLALPMTVLAALAAEGAWAAARREARIGRMRLAASLAGAAGLVVLFSMSDRLGRADYAPAALRMPDRPTGCHFTLEGRGGGDAAAIARFEERMRAVGGSP
ncbi:hypothetical protein [Muricoccus radiodurans]|uniref:hypothetical protein n=1 Tax=Muricoccus radiodurans TaxID=2231721 RepID=UPI003CE8ADDD